MAKQRHTYTTISGRDIEHDQPSREVQAFLERLRAAVADPAVSENDVIALIYGRENPVMDQSIFADRGAVTPAVMADPLYHVVSDHIDRKRIALGTFDVEAAAARFTMTPQEAAEQLGCHVSAVRQAIDRWRLPAWKRDGRWYLEPRSVEAYRVGNQGPVARPAVGQPLTVRIGKVGLAPDGDTIARIKHAGAADLVYIEPGIREGSVTGWRRAAVLMSRASTARLFVVEPSNEQNEIAFDGFFVRGLFKVVVTENNARRAREGFKTFEPQ